jgi:glucose-6-phosphate 1-dehydrogenase
MTTAIHEPHLFVILGATGDLTARKLMPALQNIMNKGGRWQVLGVATSNLDDESFRKFVAEKAADHVDGDVPVDRIFYHRVTRDPASYEGVEARIQELDEQLGLEGNRVFYLALPPPVFPGVIGALGKYGLNKSDGWVRIVVEKPFGTDGATAAALDEVVHEFFDESQVYRIDHYLGKETVQNLLAFRFANPVFESSWNREHIRRVNITVAESLGVGSRAQYYEKAGATRDMVQNHITQLMCLVAMEPPVAFEAEHIRAEKVKVLKAIDAVVTDEIVYGQYTAGTVAGEEVLGYLDEDGIPDDSITPTFVQSVIGVDSWRWKGVPFVLRTGKRLPERSTKIDVYFRKPPVTFFEHDDNGRGLQGNVLSIILQPNEGFQLSLDVKRPGDGMKLVHTILDFEYEDAFGELDDAYETLLSDVIEGDQTLFVHSDEVKESWRIWDGVLDCTEAPLQYEAGSDGPVV